MLLGYRGYLLLLWDLLSLCECECEDVDRVGNGLAFWMRDLVFWDPRLVGYVSFN